MTAGWVLGNADSAAGYAQLPTLPSERKLQLSLQIKKQNKTKNNRRLRKTWTGAFHFDPLRVAEADGAVGMRVGQQSLAKVVNPLVELIWNVGRLENQNHTRRRDAGVRR